MYFEREKGYWMDLNNMEFILRKNKESRRVVREIKMNNGSIN